MSIHKKKCFGALSLEFGAICACRLNENIRNTHSKNVVASEVRRKLVANRRGFGAIWRLWLQTQGFVKDLARESWEGEERDGEQKHSERQRVQNGADQHDQHEVHLQIDAVHHVQQEVPYN